MKTKRTLRPYLAIALAALLLLEWAAFAPAPAVRADEEGVTYYVDSETGNDANSGTDPAAPWKTLAHVTQNSGKFKPGDQILLKSGSVWNEPFEIKFSGADGNPITVGKYGGDAKPVINGGGGRWAIMIENRRNVTVQDLEITNFNAADYYDFQNDYYRRSGVWVRAFHKGPMNNITLQRLDIHDVTGISVSGQKTVLSTDGEWVNKNNNAAIMISAWEWESVPADKHGYFQNLYIADNYIHDVYTIGINVEGYMQDPALFHSNLIIRNNTIHRTGSDAVIVGASANPLIEHNVAYDVAINSEDFEWIAGIWVWKTMGATIQNNEVARVHYLNSASTDSTAFDVDINAKGNHLFQYNYSHDNSGGFTMDMGQLQDGITTYRYNISRNDARYRFTGITVDTKDPTIFYNNVFYNDNGDGIVLKDSPNNVYINNIFYTPQGNEPYPAGPKFYNNNFYGSVPPAHGVNNLTFDPKFVNPGATGPNAADGFKLQPDSPLIGAGKKMEDNGGRDYWGNPLYTGAPDIGAFEDPDSTVDDTQPPAKPTDLTVTDKTDTTLSLSWSAEENGVPLDGLVYDGATNAKIAEVMMSGSIVLTGLEPDTEYTFYIVARDLAGNESEPSDPLTVRTTIPSIVVDNGDADFAGTWTTVSGNGSYGADFAAAPKGDGSATAEWTPDLAEDGYYAVYVNLPKGVYARATNAPFTVHFDGGSKTYRVNERIAPGGQWELLGIHQFAAGTTGSVLATNDADGQVIFDTTPVKNEIAAFNNAKGEFSPGLLSGTLDPDEYLPKFQEKIRSIGGDKIIAEIQKQLDEWLANK